MILCHKCSGLLAYEVDANIEGLQDCSCISGYVRGFEPSLNREQAIEQQIKRNRERITLYTRQGRDQSWIDRCNQVIAKLEALRK